MCEICFVPGVTHWTLKNEDRTVHRTLCTVHSDPIRLLLDLTPENQWRYSNPGDNPLEREHVIGGTDLGTLDWMTPLEDAA